MKIDLGQKSVQNRNQICFNGSVSIAIWVTLFTLAYAQSPLYTSNQNQYFLHGLADAGLGYLNHDWLANTLDPTPVFSGLIYLTARFIPWSPVFYLYFALLAGIYIYSLYGILSKTFDLSASHIKQRVYLLALILVHSAALRYLVVRIFSQDWVYLFDGGVAGQRLLGSVLQPSTFGVLLILSIYLYLQGNLVGAVISLVLAPTFHPTYLLSAAVLTLVYMGIVFYSSRQLRRPIFIGAGALLGVSPTLVYTFLTFGGTYPDLTARARELLVNFRIPHHALPSVWFDGSAVVKALFIVLALYLTRKTRLFHFLCWPFVVALLGTLVQLFTGSNVLALLFPWRLSTWLVPLSVGTLLFWSLEVIWPWLERKEFTRFVVVLSALIAMGLAGTGLLKSTWEYLERVNRKDRAMMSFVFESKTPEDVYVVPLDMQVFRLETGAPVYVEFKSIPYKDRDILEWYRRVSTVGNLYRAPIKRSGCEVVAKLAMEGVTHVVLPYDHTIKTCSNLERLYGDWHYGVFAVKGQRQ